MKTFSIRLSFTDRRLGPGTGRMLTIEGGSFTSAIGKAVREFWKQLDTKERNDVRRSGLKIEAQENKGGE